MGYDIYSNFDLEQHKANFINYLEVIITPDGTVHYAVPSHIQKAVQLACKKLQVSEEELAQRCPREYYCAWMDWVLAQSGSIAVWFDGFAGQNPTRKQQAILRKMKMSGIYRGPISKPNR